MKVVRVDRDNPDPEVIEEAAALIRAGRLVAFPTETVYGLGGNALDAQAVERIFQAKARPEFNPLIAHCPDLPGARALAAEWPPVAETLGRAFWPGPLTLVVMKRPDVPDRLTAGLPTVAVRVPSHPVARALLLAAEVPIAAPSANRFTELSPTTGAHVARALSGQVDLVLDAGPTEVGIESVVIDVSGDRPTLLRPGSIPESLLEKVVGEPLARPVPGEGSAPRPSPGMVDRHYSPRARLVLAPPTPSQVLEELVARELEAGHAVGALLQRGNVPHGITYALRMPDDAAGYARELYAALHDLDDARCDVILVEEPPDAPGWEGVLDRLRRAARPG